MAAEPRIVGSFEPIKSRLRLSLPDDDRGFDTGLHPAELRVRVDHELGAIGLQLEAADVELVLSAAATLQLIVRLMAASHRLQGWEEAK
jgi:hypothetical protein